MDQNGSKPSGDIFRIGAFSRNQANCACTQFSSAQRAGLTMAASSSGDSVKICDSIFVTGRRSLCEPRFPDVRILPNGEVLHLGLRTSATLPKWNAKPDCTILGI